MAEGIAQWKLNFHPSSPMTVVFDAPHISSDGGALVLRQMDDRLGLSERDAYERLRQRARDKRAKMKDIAQAIIEAEELLGP